MKETDFESTVEGKAQLFIELYGKTFDGCQFSETHPEAYEAINYFLHSKGKRIRPLLVMLACDAFGQPVEKALNPAFGIELFHNFTLIHDDIMDKAQIRRGRPTLHEKFGEGTAILAGDFLLILAYRYLARVDPPHLPVILTTFNQAATQIIEGQVMDASFEEMTSVSEADYLQMIEYKTSVLLASSLKIGAVVGNASEEDLQHIYDFGINLGLAFQIKDDWLDVYGDKSLGKKIGGDILRNKKTYPFIKAFNRLDEARREDLKQLGSSEDAEYKIRETIKIYNEVNVGQETEEFMNVLYGKALAALDKSSLASDKRADLKYFAQQIYERQY